MLKYILDVEADCSHRPLSYGKSLRCGENFECQKVLAEPRTRQQDLIQWSIARKVLKVLKVLTVGLGAIRECAMIKWPNKVAK